MKINLNKYQQHNSNMFGYCTHTHTCEVSRVFQSLQTIVFRKFGSVRLFFPSSSSSSSHFKYQNFIKIQNQNQNNKLKKL